MTLMIQKLIICLSFFAISFPITNLYSQCDIDDPLNLPWLQEFIDDYPGVVFCDSTNITISQFEYLGETYIMLEFDFIGGLCDDLTNGKNFYDCSGNLDCTISPYFNDPACVPYSDAADATGEVIFGFTPACNEGETLNEEFVQEIITEFEEANYVCSAVTMEITEIIIQGDRYLIVDVFSDGALCNNIYQSNDVYSFCTGNRICDSYGGPLGFFNPERCAFYNTYIESTGEVIYSNTIESDPSGISDENILLENFPWLPDLIDINNCESTDQIDVFISGTYYYLQIEVGGNNTIYDQNGDFYCSSSSSFDCLEFYGLNELVFSWSCNNPGGGNTGGNNNNNTEIEDLFEAYSWLENFVESDPACEEITVFDLGSYTFVYITDAEGNNGELYFQDGTFYCSDSPGFSCVTAYNLPPTDPINVCDETPNTGGGEENPAILEDFPWLEDIVEADSDCEQITIYDLDAYSFIFITDEQGNNGELYFEDGTFYCSDSPGFSCVEAYSLPATASSSICDETPNTGGEEDPAIFADYPWLNSVVDPDNCIGTQISIYAFGSSQMLQISSDGNVVLYLDDGTLYCTNSPNLDCVEIYGLTELISSWSCTEDRPIDDIEDRPIDENVSEAVFETERNKWDEEILDRGSELEMKVYPNPSNGPLFVELYSKDAPLQILSLYDVQGRLLENIALNETLQQKVLLDLVEFTSGFYYIKVQFGDRQKIKRIVKQ